MLCHKHLHDCDCIAREEEREEERKKKEKERRNTYLTRQIQEVESELKNCVPQARFIRHGNEIMNFEVE